MIVIDRATALPDDFGVLVDAAGAESLRMVRRLADEYRSGANRFDGPGEGLWEARCDGMLVGICGLNVDPFAAPDERCGRVRRLYVHSAWRQRRVAASLLQSVKEHAVDHCSKLTAFTGDGDVVSFYLACGFRPVAGIARRSVEYEI